MGICALPGIFEGPPGYGIRVLPTSPVRVEYELTEAGRDLERAVRLLSEWASKWWDSPEMQAR